MSEEKNRGGCLTAFLIIMSICNMIGILSNLFLLNLNSPAFKLSKDLVIFSIVISIIQIISIILIFNWRKTGVILYFGIGLLNPVISLISKPVGSDSSFIIGSAIATFATYLIAFFLIRPVWKHLT